MNRDLMIAKRDGRHSLHTGKIVDKVFEFVYKSLFKNVFLGPVPDCRCWLFDKGFMSHVISITSAIAFRQQTIFLKSLKFHFLLLL